MLRTPVAGTSQLPARAPVAHVHLLGSRDVYSTAPLTSRQPAPPTQAFITSPEVLAVTFLDMMQILDAQAATVLDSSPDDLMAAARMTSPSKGVGTVDDKHVLVIFDRAADAPAGPEQD